MVFLSNSTQFFAGRAGSLRD